MLQKLNRLLFTHTPVGFENPGRSELPQLVAYHIFRDIDVRETLPAVHHEGESNEIRGNHGAPAPCLYWLFVALIDRCVDFGE